jgi:urease accessory protein
MTHQRSRGAAQARYALIEGHPRLREMRQEGSAKIILLPGPEGVFLNTAGGLTGGDRLAYSLHVGAGCHVTATTQTAERVYRSSGGHAALSIDFDVGAGGHLDWLPQETILFDGAAARRKTTITLAEGASCLVSETVILGRAAMGETLRTVDFRDTRLVRRGAHPLHMETLALDAARLASGAAGLAGARAFASLVLVARDAADRLDALRAHLAGFDTRAAASAMAGRLVVRLMADDGWPLRRHLAHLIPLLRAGPLPRVWQN